MYVERHNMLMQGISGTKRAGIAAVAAVAIFTGCAGRTTFNAYDMHTSVYQQADQQETPKVTELKNPFRGKITVGGDKKVDEEAAKKEDAVEKIVRARAQLFYVAMQNAAQYDGTKLAKNANLGFFEEVITEANYAAKELQIPRRIIISQWAFESGRFQEKEAWYIRYNNLGGFMVPDKNGDMVLEKFSSLHHFTLAYVKTMKAMGVEKIYDVSGVVRKMKDAGYFVGPTTEYYAGGVKGVYNQLGDALDKNVTNHDLKSIAR